jgi:hypothetical protein
MLKLSLLLTLLVSSFSFAYESREVFVDYYGQSNENVQMNYDQYETRYRDEPYQDRVCEDRTDYRRECRTTYQNVCRTVTRYRQRCTTTPSRQVCRTNPRGGRVCRTVPGRRVCRQVPYQDRVCRQEPRQVCRQVPYRRRVCRDVTRYRRVPYRALVRSYLASLNINFQGQYTEALTFKARINDLGRVTLELFTQTGNSYVTVLNENQYQTPIGNQVQINANFDLLIRSQFEYMNEDHPADEKLMTPIKE